MALEGEGRSEETIIIHLLACSLACSVAGRGRHWRAKNRFSTPPLEGRSESEADKSYFNLEFLILIAFSLLSTSRYSQPLLLSLWGEKDAFRVLHEADRWSHLFAHSITLQAVDSVTATNEKTRGGQKQKRH